MPLPRQKVAISLRGGLDTKTDPKQVVAGKVLKAENVVFTTPGQFRKRNGYTALSTTIAGTDTQITSGEALMRRENELLLADGADLYSWDAGARQWNDKGAMRSVNVTRKSVLRNTRTQSEPCGVTHPATGLQAFTYTQKSRAYYSVIDGTTGQSVVGEVVLGGATTFQRALVLVVGSRFLFVGVTSEPRVYFGTLSTNNPTATVTMTAVTDTGGDGNSVNSSVNTYDALAMDTSAGTQVYLSFYNDVGGTSLWRFDPSDLSAPADKYNGVDGIVGVASPVLAVLPEPYVGGPVVAMWSGSGAGIGFRAFSWNLVAQGGGPIEIPSADVDAITGGGVSADSLDLRIYWTLEATAPGAFVVRQAQWTGGYMLNGLGVTVPAAPTSDFLRSVGLAARSFTYDGQIFVPVVHDSTLQPTYFVADGDGRIVAKALPGTGGGLPGYRVQLGFSNVVDTGTSTRFMFACQEVTQLAVTDGTLSGTPGVSALTLDFFEPELSYLRGSLAHTIHVGGGFLQMYDGVNVVEHGFHIFPEDLDSNAVGSGHTYQYIACYEWPDNMGQIQRSRPSIALTATATDTPDSTPIDVTVPTLRLTSKVLADRDRRVSIVLYRTEDNGTVFYRCESPIPNDPTIDSVTFTDNTPDSTLIGNPLLYTTDGTLPNTPTPPVSAITVHGNRLWVLDSTNPLTLTYSQETGEGEPVDFPIAGTQQVDPTGGDVTAIASMDDSLVIFKGTSIFRLTGRGPDATGALDDYSGAILVTTDCGCSNPRSVVIIPDGLIFQSAKGIYLLTRAMEAKYIGADVEAFSGNLVTGGALIPTTNQIRLTLADSSEGPLAVEYDYYAGQWSSLTNVSAVDATLWNDTFLYLRSSGVVLQETAGVFSDNGSYVRMRLMTSWLQFAQLAGFQRIYELEITGQFKSAHRLRIRAAYDFNPALIQEAYIDPEGGTAYGEGPFGDGVYGGDFPTYIWRFYPEWQKCTAIRFVIEDVQSGTTTGESLNLSGLSLEIGIKKGLQPRPATASTG